jgi:endonuclease-3 related protein
MTNSGILLDIYNRLFQTYGPQSWWPGDSPEEVAIGAILTQNTNWENVQKAIDNLKRENLLQIESIAQVSEERLSSLIRPSGFFNQKTRRLKTFVHFLITRYDGSFTRMGLADTERLRAELLSLNGVGPETADSILLYALNKPIFVVDAYTKRILSRHGLIEEKATYETVQRLFHRTLPQDVQLFNEYHALIVMLAKTHCRAKPICKGCPLEHRNDSDIALMKTILQR